MQKSGKGAQLTSHELLQAAISYAYVALWISLSATVILYNKCADVLLSACKRCP